MFKDHLRKPFQVTIDYLLSPKKYIRILFENDRPKENVPV